MEKIAVNIGDVFFGTGGHFLKETTGVGTLVSIILSNAIVIAGILLFFLFLFGGISMIIGAGQSSPEKAARGRQAVTAAVIGFIIIFGAYWIIQIIEKITHIDIL
jgi:hypothetical protein